jgi:hypothetical protein
MVIQSQWDRKNNETENILQHAIKSNCTKVKYPLGIFLNGRVGKKIQSLHLQDVWMLSNTDEINGFSFRSLT